MQTRDLTGKLTDEELFGNWDVANSNWNLKGKINYNYNAKLKEIEKCVKLANYKEAREELFKYYKNKSNKRLRKSSNRRDQSSLFLDMFSDGIYSVIDPICLLTVPSNEDYIYADVHKCISAKTSQNVKSISFF